MTALQIIFSRMKKHKTFPRLTWDEQKSIPVARLNDGACDDLNTFLNESMLCWFIGLQRFKQHQRTIYIYVYIFDD